MPILLTVTAAAVLLSGPIGLITLAACDSARQYQQHHSVKASGTSSQCTSMLYSHQCNTHTAQMLQLDSILRNNTNVQQSIIILLHTAALTSAAAAVTVAVLMAVLIALAV
jgi:hypothetical protein